MAVDPLKVPISRDDVYAWLEEYTQSGATDVRAWLEEKLGEHAELTVNTRSMDSLRGSTPLIEMILDDLPSYGFDLDA